MGLINGQFMVQTFLRQLKADEETSRMGAQLVADYANAKDKGALVKAWLRAALDFEEP